MAQDRALRRTLLRATGGNGGDEAGQPASQVLALGTVADLTDEHLDDVLEEDHAGHRPVLRDDPGQVGAGALHRGQDILDLVLGRHGGQGPHPLVGDGLLVPLVVGVQDVLEVDVPLDLLVGAEVGVARVPVLGDEPLDVGGCDPLGDRDERLARDRDVRGDLVAELERAADQAPALLLEQAFAVALRDDEARPPRR